MRPGLGPALGPFPAAVVCDQMRTGGRAGSPQDRGHPWRDKGCLRAARSVGIGYLSPCLSLVLF